MMTVLPLLIAEFAADLIWVSVFIEPPDHLGNWKKRAALSVLLMAAIYIADASLTGMQGPLHLVLTQACALLLVFLNVDGKPLSNFYLFVWIVLSQSLVQQSWNVAYYWSLERLFGQGFGWYLYPVWALAAAVPAYFLLARRMPTEGRYIIGPRQGTSAIVLLILFDTAVLVSLYGGTRLTAGNDNSMLLLIEFYCLTFLYLQYVMFKDSALQKELLTAKLLFRQQKEQYELSKENIELINHKCHDLKHQVAALRGMNDNEEKKRRLDEIDSSIQIYESIVNTGSEVLDTILTEKSLVCAEKGIRIQCIADGAQTGFMNPVDLYAVFGNLLDNAMEAVRDFTDPHKRLIDVLVRVQQQFLVVSVTNPIEKLPVFEDGLPVTTKGDRDYHGFGLPSVRRTVKGYGGHMTVETKEHMFTVKILIPLP